MERTSDFLILGGGVIGLSIAYFLAKEGERVTIVDRGGFGQEASWAGAGIIPAGNPARAKSPMGRLRAAAVSLFPSFSEELRELTGIDNGFRRCGGLEIRQSENDLEKKRHQLLLQAEKGEGLHCQVLSKRDLRSLEPELSDEIPGAIYFSEVAQVRNPWHIKALIAACDKLGVKMMPLCPVEQIIQSGERISGVVTPRGLLTGGRIVVAGGAWTEKMMAGLAWKPVVFPVKGQIVLYQTRPAMLRHILLSGSRYLVPRGDGLILAGSTEEHSEFDKSVTDSGTVELKAFSQRLVPNLITAPIEKTWAGLRPACKDNRPYLGSVPGLNQLYVASGHFRSGLQLSILTGMLMRDMLMDRPTQLDMSPFRLDRQIKQAESLIAHAL